MRFGFNVILTDEDYYKFNLFMNFKSYYGRKQMLRMILYLGIAVLLVAAIVLVTSGINQASFIRIATIALTMVAWMLVALLIIVLFLRVRIKSMSKKGRLNYSPVADMEFYDDYFTETTEKGKVECKYSAIDRVSVVQGKETVYIHASSMIAYIMPRSTFESNGQYCEFVEFIKTKCNNVDVY